MNTAVHLICAAALLSASPALSEAVPRSGSLDNRVRTATYVENQVFVIETDLRHSTTIHFGAGERFDAVIVGDTDGVIVIPAELADEIADEAVEMTAFEDFVTEKVFEGRSILGLYPATDPETSVDFEAWRKANGR